MSEKLKSQKNLAVILPSLDPDTKFSAVVQGLVDNGFEKIVIVDDGSCQEKQHFFDEAAARPQCTVLHHEVNKGKGRALKDAFTYVLKNCPGMSGVITIDGDGQHLVGDIIACGEKMLENPDTVIMGCRNFNAPGVPTRNGNGNKFTSLMFRVCYGIKLSDTQTGLRAIPFEYLESFAGIDGERFEYETNMILQMKRMGIDFIEQPIATVYDPDDYSTHYNVFKDSWRIFKIMFKFLISSFSSMLIDLGLFTLIFQLAKENPYATLIATVAARICSSFFNFNANKTVVFKEKGHYKQTMLRYYCLCIPQMLVSAGLVTLLNNAFNNNSTLIATLLKFIVDTVLFFISYNIQREWVFSSKKK